MAHGMGSEGTIHYRDGRITCDERGVAVRWYYLWGTKRFAYDAIKSWQRVDMGALRGKGRIWGTSNPRLWANLDPARPSKRVAFVVDLGRFVRPFLTPDDPDSFGAVLAERAPGEPDSREGGTRAPLV